MRGRPRPGTPFRLPGARSRALPCALRPRSPPPAGAYRPALRADGGRHGLAGLRPRPPRGDAPATLRAEPRPNYYPARPPPPPPQSADGRPRPRTAHCAGAAQHRPALSGAGRLRSRSPPLGPAKWLPSRQCAHARRAVGVGGAGRGAGPRTVGAGASGWTRGRSGSVAPPRLAE